MISKIEIDNVVETIINYYHPEKIILFGSYALGNADENSDLDICVVKKDNRPRQIRQRELAILLADTKLPLEIIVLKPEDLLAEVSKNNIKYDIVNKGKVVYDSIRAGN
jgi:predicted nucleotidyltransferase